MYSNDLNNSYSYARERRKDEMHEAAQSHLLREFRGNRKSSPRLVAALSGLALVLAVLSLLLMGCSPQTVQMEPKANSVPEATSYQAVLGKSLSDKDVADFMAIHNCSSAAQFQLCNDEGMALLISSDQIVETVYLYLNNIEGFAPYKGELPFGLKFYDTMDAVEYKLNKKGVGIAGLPDSGDTPDHLHYLANYQQVSMTIIYNSPSAEDEDATIHAILMSK
jgi:hypothetical protein